MMWLFTTKRASVINHFLLLPLENGDAALFIHPEKPNEMEACQMKCDTSVCGLSWLSTNRSG